MNPELAAQIIASKRFAEADDWGVEALAANEQLVLAFPTSVELRMRLAHCLAAANDLVEAARAYEWVAEHGKPDSADRRIAIRLSGEVRERVQAGKVSNFQEAQRRALGFKEGAKMVEALVWHQRAVELAVRVEDKTLALGSWAASLRGLRDFENAHKLVRESIAVDAARETNRLAYLVLVATLVDLGQVR